jgi:hypothetical protein
MTNEPTQSPMPEQSPGSEKQAGGAMTSQFTTPTGMVALGGIVLIATWLVFGVLLNDYWIGWLALLLAVVAVLLLRGSGSFAEKIAPIPVLAKTIGYLLALIGVFALVEDLRFADGTLNEFPDVIGALASYAGYVIAFMGARSIKT